MKKIILIVLVVFSCVKVYGQNKDEYKRMVDSAIILQTVNLEQISYKDGIYLIDQKDQSYYLSLDNGKNKFNSINVFDKKNRGRLKKGIHAWKILPAHKDNRLIVNVIHFYITYKNHNYNFANGGGATVIFEYHCDTSKWVLINTKWSGI